MELIKVLVEQAIQRLQPKPNNIKQKILSVWQESLTKEYRQHCKVINFRNRCLLVNIDSSGWLYQLSLKKGQLIKKLNKRLKQDIIEDIFFRIGKVNEPSGE